MSFRTLFFIYILLVSTNLIMAQEEFEEKLTEEVEIGRNDLDVYEEFALSDKREEVLKKLIPGTEIYYFLHILYFQQNNKIKEAEEMLAKWEERIPTSYQIEMMKNRQAILDFDSKPENTYQFLKKYLNLEFDHTKPISQGTSIYPTSLNPETYNHEAEFDRLLLNKVNLEGFSEAGLFQVSKKKLTPAQLLSLLEGYPYCDLPNLTDFILKDFNNYDTRTFGQLGIHLKLTLTQLNELKTKKPDLLTHEAFVLNYLNKLSASNSQKLQNKPLLFKKYLLECWAFVKPLNPSFNSLKANILFAYLNTCLELNQPDNNLFSEYLKLPRQAIYANNEFYQKNNLSNAFIQFDKTFPSICYTSYIQSDIKLIETYLFQLIKSSANMNEYQMYFEKAYFNKFEAESKIKTGLGKPDEYYNVLGANDLETLKNSVEISFTEQNQKLHLSKDLIKLFLQIKNVNELEIHVYKLNMLDFYRSNNKEMEQNISLEGYIPNISKKISYQKPSYIRHEEQIDLTEITEPGVYIIELFGNGIKTRTFIRKGSVFPAIYESNSGHEIQLFDDTQNQIVDYTVYFGQHELKSDNRGIVMLPYADEKNIGEKTLIFSYKEIACFYRFNHINEKYKFSNSILNHLESIIPGQNCKLIFKPSLQLNDKPIDVAIIKNLTVELKFSTRGNEILSSRTIYIDKPKDCIELDSFIPESAIEFTLKLSGNIYKKANSEEMSISTSDFVTLPGAGSNTNIMGIYLRKQGENYQLECLNKAGVPQANVCLQLQLHHQFLKTVFSATLQTDQKGIIALNKLANIRYIEVKEFNNQRNRWMINSESIFSMPRELTILENDKLEIPISKIDFKHIAETILFLKQSGDSILENCTSELIIENEMLKIPTKIAGEYNLIFKNGKSPILIHVLKGKRQSNYYVTEDKISDITPYLPHQISLEKLDGNNDTIKGKVNNVHKDMKAFLWSGRYLGFAPNFSMDSWNNFEWPSHHRFLDVGLNQYFDSIKLSSEQKYIFGRKDKKKFPGNLLPMPSAILNPWDTSLAEGSQFGGTGGGGSFGSRSGGGKRRAVMKGGGSKASELTLFNNSLEFLPNASIVEIAIQKDGSFEVSIKDFKDQSYFQIGLISPYGFIIKEIPLTPTKTKILDIRQNKNNAILDDKLPTTSMTVVQADKPITFLQGEDKEILTVSSLSKLHFIFKEIFELSKIDEFNFLSNWNSMAEPEKLIKYQKYACHELHFYIYQKDKKFFEAHIKPFLKNKQQKTFIDQWLLEEDLSGYLNLNPFNNLNLFEKILLAKRYPMLKEKINSQISEHLEVYKPDRENEVMLMNRLLNALQSSKELKPLEDSKLVTESSDMQKVQRYAIVMEKSQDKMGKQAKVLEPIRELVENKEELAEDDLKETILYRDVKETKEYAEANYYHMERKSETTKLINPSQFWLDYLNNTSPSFISENILSFQNIHESLLAIALMDLPEKEVETNIETKENQVIIKAKAPIIVLLKSFKLASFKADTLSLKQHYFFYNGTQKEILPIDKPFLINRQYNCLSVITNTTSEVKEFYLNYLIPEGSLPLDLTLRKQQKFIKIEAYSSLIFEYQFFFPLSGTFSHLPAKAGDRENIFTNEKGYLITATADQEVLDKTSWEYIVLEGKKEKILAYLKTHNLLKTDLNNIYYLAKEKSFFDSLTNELKNKLYFDQTLWSYSVFHEDKNKLQEYLPNTQLKNSCGTYFNSTLLKVDPIELKLYEHKEYLPLIKSRSHPIENGNKFENLQFEMHYSSFIQVLMYKPKLNNSDLLNIVIYTLNQQRISEAIKYFVLIKENEINEKLQYDYLKAYFAFYQEDLPMAEKILSKYKDLAIPQWKEKFDELGIQLNEIKTGQIDIKSRGDIFSSTVLADKEAILSSSNDQGNIKIIYKNLTQCRVDYYLTDLEILFSNSPFEVMKNQFQFLTVPNFSETLTLNSKADSHALSIPENLKSKNLVLKISGAGKNSVATYNPNQMDITISENYGELRILSIDAKKPLSSVYVKVYGEKEGGNEFVKDGYTDLRGIFNYTSVSGKPINQFKKLAILIISEKNGAAIQYTNPPAH